MNKYDAIYKVAVTMPDGTLNGSPIAEMRL